MSRGVGEADSFSVLFDLIGELARRRYQAAERNFAAIGLNHTEARLLVLLMHEGGDAAQDTLSNMLFVDRTNAGRALKSLEARGYIERRKDAADKRTNHVAITTKGREATVQIDALRQEIIARFFGDLSVAEADMIVPLLDKALKTGQ